MVGPEIDKENQNHANSGRAPPLKGSTLPEPSSEIEAYIRESFIRALSVDFFKINLNIKLTS